MEAEPIRWSTEDLLGEAEWLGKLARRLVSDPNEADDVVQDTWIAAIGTPPARERPLRPWLAQVARNFARMRRRSGAAREVREQSVSRRAEAPGPEELAQRLESQRLLVNALARLREPYRSTVLLVYFEHRTSEEIARQQGISAGTVRWRLSAAIEQLREQLDRDNDSRGDWVSALAPLARAPDTLIPAALHGAILMSTLMKVGAAAAAAVLLFVALSHSGLWPSDTPALSTEPVAVRFKPLETEPPTRAPQGEEQRAIAPVPAEPAAPAATPKTNELAQASIRARFVDETGRAIAGATLATSPHSASEPAQASSGIDGRVELAIRFPRAILAVRASWDAHLESRCLGWTRAVHRISLQQDSTAELGDIVLAPGGDISGRVVGKHGRAIEGAVLRLEDSDIPQSEMFELRSMPVFQSDEEPWTVSRPDGSFVYSGAPVGFVRLAAGLEEYRTTFSAPIEVRAGQESGGVELILEPIPDSSRIAGRVIDPSGQPVPHAGLNCSYHSMFDSGSASFIADEDGHFSHVISKNVEHDLEAADFEKRFGVARKTGIEPGTLDVVLQLRELVVIEVSVRAANAGPIESFTVRAFDPDHPGGRASTGAGPHKDGVARFAPASERFVVEVEAQGFEIARQGPFSNGIPAHLDFALQPQPGIRGRVTGAGEGLAGATLIAYSRGKGHHISKGFRLRFDPEERARTGSADAGAFEMTLRQPGDFTFLVEADGWATAEVEIDRYDPKLGRPGLDVELVRGGSIEGRVVTRGGRNPAGLIVGFSRGDGRAFTRRVASDGAYRAENLAPGRWDVCRVDEEIRPNVGSTQSWGRGKWDEIPSVCTVADSQVTHFDLDLEGAKAAAILLGRIQVDGAPPGAWTVSLVFGSLGSPQRDNESVKLDAEGRFRLESERPGDAQAVVTASGGTLDGLRVVQPVNLHSGENDLSLDLTTARIALEGIVVDPPIGLVWMGERGVFAIRPIQSAGNSTLAVPSGRVKLWRFDPETIDMDPSHWSALAETRVEPGATAILRMP
ncbi:MAG TPA: sigma-70 family RNA polymerase sigma factor [Planctomycetota bacterium]|nr:sigma-70 family RNA polymerase sigma factor [Planctomycetota bacterium]